MRHGRRWGEAKKGGGVERGRRRGRAREEVRWRQTEKKPRKGRGEGGVGGEGGGFATRTGRSNYLPSLQCCLGWPHSLRPSSVDSVTTLSQLSALSPPAFQKRFSAARGHVPI